MGQYSAALTIPTIAEKAPPLPTTSELLALAFLFMPDALSMETNLCPLEGPSRPLSQWLTTFPLAIVVLDPYTHESSWILETARRILGAFREADVRVAFLTVGSDADGVRRFLGPLVEEILVFMDPDRSVVEALGLSSLPTFVVIRQDGSILGTAEGWEPAEWRDLADKLATLTNWSRPEIPTPTDPMSYQGTQAVS